MPPARSIISLKACPDEGCPALLIGCDCATTTHLIVEDADSVPDGAEAAFTCDGCHSVHWFTIRRHGREAG
jgi:hypothetical protein